MTFARPDGTQATRCNRRGAPRRTPTQAQALATRNLLWLCLSEGRHPHPVSGRPYRYSVAEIAGLWAVTTTAVRNGLQGGQRAREQILAIRDGVAA